MVSLREDNIMPNSGRFYAPTKAPSQQIKDKKLEEAETLAQVPLLKKQIERWDKQIAATDSIKESFALANKYAISKENAQIVLDTLNDLLKAEKGYTQSLIKKTK